MKNTTKIQLGQNGPFVSKLGLGCMRMSSIWGGPTPNETESIATIHEALDRGMNFLNTGDFYGAGHNEMLIGKAIKGRRDDAYISVKFGAIFHNGQWLGMDLRPIAIKNFINYSLTRLGIETIDLYQPSRMDESVPVEDIIGTVADLIKEGKVRKHWRIGNYGRPTAESQQHLPHKRVRDRLFAGRPSNRARTTANSKGARRQCSGFRQYCRRLVDR